MMAPSTFLFGLLTECSKYKTEVSSIKELSWCDRASLRGAILSTVMIPVIAWSRFFYLQVHSEEREDETVFDCWQQFGAVQETDGAGSDSRKVGGVSQHSMVGLHHGSVFEHVSPSGVDVLSHVSRRDHTG